MPDVFSTLEDTDPTTVLDYTSRDFTAIRSQLVGLAKGLMPEWQTAGEPSDFGTLLLELYAYVGDVMHFYIDRTASEAFLGTAIRRQSVLYIADMLGYTPIGQQSAIVKLEFSLVTDPSLPDDYSVVIPVGTTVHNEASDASELIIFQTNTEITLYPGDGVGDTPPVTAIATEGIMVYDYALGKSAGAPNTEMVLLHKGVVYNSVSVKTREGGSIINWTYTSDLSLARPTQAAFTTFIDDSEYTHIVFGDNAVGRVPPINAEVFATYRYGVGAEANALLAGDLTVLVADTTTTTADFWGVSVTNPEAPVGGTDPESIDAMRNSIPRAAARIKNRAITLNDYADLALQVPGVAKSMSHGEVYTAVHVVIAPNEGQGPDEYMQLLCASVQRYMSDKIIVGSQVYVEPSTGVTPLITQLWNYTFIRVMVHVQEAYNRTTVRLAVEHSIRQMMDFNAVDFGTRISLGNVYRVALAVQGVEWVDVWWLNTDYPGGPTIDSTPTDPERVIAEKAMWDEGGPATDRLVADIVTPSTKIPKINETEVIEAEADWPITLYPDLTTADERTHDGLWVRATGGLIGT